MYPWLTFIHNLEAFYFPQYLLFPHWRSMNIEQTVKNIDSNVDLITQGNSSLRIYFS